MHPIQTLLSTMSSFIMIPGKPLRDKIIKERER